jgi:multicomponent Na+:H+ antiporter subunit B
LNDVIVKTITKLIIPFVEVYGIFIILHGHVSPGGGFSGGALIGASLILYTIVFGVKKGEQKFSHRASEFAESGGIFLYVLVGLVGMIFAGSFLANISAGFPLGEVGTLISGGMIPILMVGIGIKVASTIITLFHILIQEDEL